MFSEGFDLFVDGTQAVFAYVHVRLMLFFDFFSALDANFWRHVSKELHGLFYHSVSPQQCLIVVLYYNIRLFTTICYKTIKNGKIDLIKAEVNRGTAGIWPIHTVDFQKMSSSTSRNIVK